MVGADRTRDEVWLRDVEDPDIECFFTHQLDPEAIRMAAFPARDHGPFLTHWTRIRADPTVFTSTIVTGGVVVGNVVSWQRSGRRMVGYWLDRNYWGRGVATRALRLFLDQMSSRPLYAHVAVHNAGSIRVLEKCGFRQVEAAPGALPGAPPGTVASTVDNAPAEVVLLLAG